MRLSTPREVIPIDLRNSAAAHASCAVFTLELHLRREAAAGTLSCA